MRLRDALWLMVAAILLAGGCSRLTFVRPSAARGEAERVAPEWNIRGTRASRQHAAAGAHLARAQQRLAAGDTAQAEAEARAALKAAPRSAEGHTLLGVIAERRGDLAGAGPHYRRAAELAPNRGAMLNNYGVWLCRSGRAAESLGWFERALADPAYATPAAALANAGACALQAGQRARADQQARAAIALDPASAVALGALAQLAFDAGDYLEARAFSQRRLDAAPADAHALVLASQIEHKLGDTRAAAGYVRRLREEFPDAAPGNPGDNTQQ